LGIGAIRVDSYLEALGVLVCDRAGISPLALKTTIAPIQALQGY